MPPRRASTNTSGVSDMTSSSGRKSCRLADVVTLIGGNGFSECFQGGNSVEIPFFKVSDMNSPGNQRHLCVANNYVDRALARAQGWRLLPPQTVVFAKVGAALLHNRRRLLVQDSLIDNNMMGAVPGNGIDSVWLYWWLQTVDFATLAQVGALPSVNQRDIGRLRIEVPSLEEQRRIAEIMDTIDETIRATERVIAKLQMADVGLRRDLLDGRSGGLRLEDWRHCRIGDFANVQRGASPRPIDNPAWFSDNGPGWIRISDVTAAGDVLLRTRDKLSQAGAARSRRAGPGDVIMSIAATIGVAIVVGMEACYHDGFVRLEHDSSVTPEFLVMLLEHHKEDFLRSGQTGTQANINSNIVAKAEVAVPSLEVQSAIVAAAASARRELRSEQAYVRSLRQMCAGLAHDLFSDRVRTVST